MDKREKRKVIGHSLYRTCTPPGVSLPTATSGTGSSCTSSAKTPTHTFSGTCDESCAFWGLQFTICVDDIDATAKASVLFQQISFEASGQGSVFTGESCQQFVKF